MSWPTHPYIPTKNGWLYLATVIDLYSRQVIGWSMTDNMKVKLVKEMHPAFQTKNNQKPIDFLPQMFTKYFINLNEVKNVKTFKEIQFRF